MELDLPNSALEDIELSSSFPQPPEADGSDSHSVSKVDLRSWYYILAEIAVRHILNRLLRFQTRFDGSLDERQILQLFEDADLFTEQLAEWHRLLPPMFHFEEPTGKTLGVESDDMRFVLRYRFMQCRDLIARPFLKICFDELPHKLSLPQQKSVLQRASVCLDVCMLKMTQVRLEWHQGIWYMLRTQAANVAIVLAVALTRHETHATLAQKLRLPEGWKDRIVQVMGKVAPFWTDQNDRLAHMRLVLERGLGAVG